MIDKIGRQRILIAEQKIDRLERIIEDMINAQLTSFSQAANISLPNGQCTHCYLGLYPGFICQQTDCPHGLDELEQTK